MRNQGRLTTVKIGSEALDPRARRRAAVRRWASPAVRRAANRARAPRVPATGKMTLTLATTRIEATTRTGCQRARAAGSLADGPGAAVTGRATAPAPGAMTVAGSRVAAARPA